MKQPFRRTLSMLLSVAMIFSMTGMSTVFATEGDTAIEGGKITAFAALEETTARQTVPQGTEKEDLNLPETLTVTVERTVAVAPDEPIVDEDGADSGNTPSAATPGNAAIGTSGVVDSGEPVITTEDIALPVTWVWQEYDPAAEVGTAFTFAPTWDTDKFPLGEGVTAPTVTVTLAAKPALFGGSRSTTTVTDADGLKTALEDTTPTTISVTADIAMGNSITLGADHTLFIAEGKTVTTGDFNLKVPSGKTLTLGGTGTLKANNSAQASYGITVEGTLKLESGCKLTAANSGESESGITLGADSAPGIITGTGTLTVENTDGTGISPYRTGSSYPTSSINLTGGALTVKSSGTAATGITSVDLTTNGTTIDIQNSSMVGIYGNNISITGGTVRVANSAAAVGQSFTGITLGTSLALTDTTVVVDIKGNGVATGISLFFGCSLTLTGTTVTLQNSSGFGMQFDATMLNMDATSVIDVKSTGGYGLVSLAGKIGTITNGAKILLTQGATLSSVANCFSDRGTPLTATGVVTIGAADAAISASGLSAGIYVWNGTHFAKAGTNQITVPLRFTEASSREPIDDCNCTNYNNYGNSVSHTHADGVYCFTWTQSSRTLTLNNLTLETDGYDIAIDLIHSANLVMEGNSTVTNTHVGSSYARAIASSNELTFSGTGELTAKVGNRTGIDSSYGVYASSITLNSGTLTAISGNTDSGESYGVYADGGTIQLNGGKITAKSLGTGANKQPFNKAPTLSGGMALVGATTWDNQTGAACTYEGPPIAPVTGVTLNKNALTLYSNTVPKEETLVATVTPADATNKAVTWSSSNTAVATVDANGKVKAVANGTAIITVKTTDGGKTASCTVTVSTYSSGSGGDSGSSGGSGSSSSGGSSTIITPPSTVEQPKPPATAETKAPATVDKNGNATVSVPEKSVTDAIKAAQDDAKKNGTTANGIAVVINTTTGKGAGSIAATLPKAAVDALIAAGVTEVTIKSDAANITLDLATLKAIQSAAGDNVTISAQPVKASTLSAEAQAAIGSRPVFNLSITAGGKAVTGFGNGSASVALPYTSAAGENTAGLYGVYVDAAGKVTYLTNSSYDANAKMMRFSTGHFSVFGIGYKAPVTFTDIATHWAKTDIEFVAGRGILSGTGNNQFSPNTGMTRGMFVTALGRLAGIDSTKYKNTKFTDVPATAYYAPYVAWAAEKGITSGTTDTTFAPDRTITRQELAVLMQNYAKAMGYTVPKTREEVKFADAASIGAFATDAVKAMQMAGVMNGKDGGKFDPTGTATRAEVAAVLHRYVELVIDIQTAQGLDTNDSGSAMMYENGKLVKSASRTVGGNTYSFNSNGEAALPPTKKAGTYTVQKGDSFWLIAKKVGCTMMELEQLNGKSRNDLIYTGMVLKVPVK